MRNKIAYLLAVISVVGFAGCQSVHTHAQADESTAAPEVAMAPSYQGSVSSAVIETELYKLTKRVTAMQSVGREFTYEYMVEASQDLMDLVITDTIPNGLQYVSSTPRASMTGNDVVWSLGELNEGEFEAVTLSVKALQTGEFANCVTVDASPKACLTVLVGAPLLTIDKSVVDESLLLGERADFNIVVTNKGNAVAENVVIVDKLPQGLTARSPLEFTIGDLAPSESRSVEITAMTTTSGEFLNVASAVGSNVESVSDDAMVYVNTAALEIIKSGPAEQYIGKRAKYEIVVTNTGDVALSNLVVTDTVGTGMQIASAAGAVGNPNTVSWDIASLPAGQSKSFTVSTTAEIAGDYCNSVEVVDSALKLSDSAQACTTWKGYPAILLEVIDTEDPLLVGEESTYVIRLTNQGNAPDYNIEITADIAAQLKILSISGETKGRVDGQAVSFETLSVLSPKQTVEYMIKVEGKEIGGGRSNFELDTKLLNGSISETESTQVY